MREQDPVHWSERHRAWVLTRYDDVSAAFRDLRLSSDRASPMARADKAELVGRDPVVSVLARWMVFRDPPDHTRMRRALRPSFTPPAIEALRPTVERVVDQLIDGLAKELDFLADFAVPLPAIVIAELLGIPPEDHARFRAWSQDLATLVFASGLRDRHRRGREALIALAGYLGEQLERRRAQPADDLLGTLAAMHTAAELTSEEATANAVLLLFAGHETTTGLLANGLAVLLAHPDELERLRTDPSLIASAVEELLRFEGPSKLMVRWASEELDLRGRRIAPGDLVFLVQAAANRDPEQFEEPHRLDLARDPNSHLGFGYGLHYCLGAPLARLETSIALSRLLDRRSRIELMSDQPRWRPNLMGRAVESLQVRLA
ncbi:MAG TPA: cytochrome P450 [Solirubrobacteraceae bacterium]|jgi:cytochrome P450|nr:cytochrome P450 [Solirubrobacteraceae bacterium]